MQLGNEMMKSARRAGTFVLVALALALSSGVAKADAVARQVSGQVEIGTGEPPTWRPLERGGAISSNDRIRTGADGRVELAMEAGTLRVHENSMLRLPPAAGGADRVDLERGHSLFDVLRRGGRRFEVHTPTVVVSVKGTRFGVDATGAVDQVAVYHGVVGVREVGAEAALETLVREGFLATAGGGRMIELDVAPQGDPWASWQDFRREVRDRHEAPSPVSDVDQARGLMHRATNEDVIRRAAERKPEVAERLRRIQKNPAGKAPDAGAPEDGSMEPVPAAPMLPSATEGGDVRKRKTMRDMMQRGAAEPQGDAMRDVMRDKQRDAVQQRMQQQAIMEEMASGGDPTMRGMPLTNGKMAMTPEAVQSLQGQILIDVLEARDDVWRDFMNSTGGTNAWPPGQFRNAMRQALNDLGYDDGTANAIVNQLDGN